MKPIYVLWLAALLITSCSSTETKIGPVDMFSFDVPPTTHPDSVNSAIGKAFLKRYALMDTSMIATGEVVPATIRSYDSATKSSKCVSGYYIVVAHEPKPDPNFEGDWHGSPSAIYFFTGKDNHFDVTNKPIVTRGSEEDAQEELSITLDYKANGACSMLGVRINNPVLVVGLTMDEHITFYYWDENAGRLRPTIVFETGYSNSTISYGAQRNGAITFIPSANALYDIEYKGTGDSTYTARYVWDNGIYRQLQTEDDQPQYVLLVDSIPGVRYPVFKSEGNSRAADAVNKALQLEDFGELISDDNRDQFFPENDTINRQYFVKRINDNMLLVSTAISYGEDHDYTREYQQRYFNARTGDEIRVGDLIVADSSQAFAKMVTRELVRAMQRAGVGKSKCVSFLRKAWEEDRVLMGLRKSNGPILTFQTPVCNLEEYKTSPAFDLWKGELRMDEIEPYLTEYFFHLAQDEVSDPFTDPFARTWHGTLDGETHVTLILRTPTNEGYPMYGGYFVYNDIGKPVNFQATTNGDDKLTVVELDETGKNEVATFEGLLQDGKLVGTYKKKDGTVMQFEAVTGK